MQMEWNQMKKLSERMSRDTRNVLSEMDRKYNNREVQLMNLERTYKNMKLSKLDRSNIDALFRLRNEINADASTLAYMAGLMDAVFILQQFDAPRF